MSHSQGAAALLKETLLETLTDISSSDEKKKEAAVKKNQELEFLLTNEFGVQLIDCAFAMNISEAVSESASEALMHYVERHWCSSFETFQPPEINSETKLKIKHSLLPGLRIINDKIRHPIADTISVMARSDWSNNWPELLDTLIEYVYADTRPLSSTYGSLRVIIALTKELTDVQLLTVGPTILREMHKILKGRAAYSKYLRSQATNVFTKMVTNVTAYKRYDLIEQCLELWIPTFCAKFLEELRLHVENGKQNADSDVEDGRENADTDEEDEELNIKIIETIGVLTKKLPKCISPFLPKFLPLIWEILNDCAEIYHKSTINLNEEELPNAFHDLVFAIIDLISALMLGGTDECPKHLPEYNLLEYHWFYLQNSIPLEVLRHLIVFIQITNEQIKLWTNELSQYITDEKLIDNLECSRSIRREAKKLLLKIVHRPERAAANALCDMLLKQIKEGDMIRASDDSIDSINWWKLHEASIQVFGIIKDIVDAKQKSESLKFDVEAFLKNVVLQDLENSGYHPLLRGSCLYVSGLYAERMPPELASTFFNFTLDGLKNKPACMRISAAKAAAFWLRSVSADGNNKENEKILSAQLPVLFQELFNLGNQLMSVEVLTIVLENLTVLTSLDKAFTASVQSSICTLTIAAFFNFRSDSSISIICQKIFSELIMNPDCIESLHTLLVPMLVAKLTVDSTEKPKDERSDLDVLQVLVQHSPQPLNSFLMESAFPAACRYILSSDNYHILLSGAQVIRTYLSVAAQLVIGFKDNDGKNGAQYISTVAAHLLNSKFTELLIDDICEIMTTLITAGNTLGENLNRLLKASLTEMMKRTQTRPCVRKLLMYARLLNTEFDAVLEFLSTAQGPNEQSALAFVLADGLCKEHESFDRDDRRIVTLALFKILEYGMTHSDSSLHQIYFHETENESEGNAEGGSEGDTIGDAIEIVGVNAEQNTEEGENRGIPFLVKITKLITSEL